MMDATEGNANGNDSFTTKVTSTKNVDSSF